MPIARPAVPNKKRCQIADSQIADANSKASSANSKASSANSKASSAKKRCQLCRPIARPGEAIKKYKLSILNKLSTLNTPPQRKQLYKYNVCSSTSTTAQTVAQLSKKWRRNNLYKTILIIKNSTNFRYIMKMIQHALGRKDKNNKNYSRWVIWDFSQKIQHLNYYFFNKI